MKRKRNKIWEYLTDVTIEKITPEDLTPAELLKEDFSKYKELLGFCGCLDLACYYAEDLGYWSNYCDGGYYYNNIDYFNAMHEYISFLVGKNWPQEVKDALNRGENQGYWES
jgi:hypothetical protein